MVSMSTQRTLSTSCTSSTRNSKYEVFLSFRGADTRHGFTSHLYDALKRLGIVAFRDDEELDKGEEVHPYLRKAIKRSQNAVVIISKKFAESKSCLFELSVIMKRRRKRRLNVFPVFYHVDPSDVRNQRGKFGKYFARLQKKEGSKVDNAEWEKWKAALIHVGDCPVDSSKDDKDPLELCGGVLKEVGNLCGWHIQNRDESKVIKEISLKILDRLIHHSTNIDKSLVGIELPVKEIMELLHLDYGSVRHTGICGTGGIGKTTLAQVVCQIVSPKFEAYCFIHGIGEKEEDGLVELQKQLIYAILSKDVADSLMNNKYNVDMVLKSRLKNKKVLIVLDDVWRRKQLDALAKAEWFGKGSRIIITSRSHDWPCLNKDNIYEVNFLNYGAALQLFCSKAFPEHCPEEKFQGLIKQIVYLAKGHPLALEVYGSYLSNKGKDDWEGYLDQLKANLDSEVEASLQITFDRMKGQGQLRNAFLDIVCFFNDHWDRQDKDYLREKLVWLGYPSNIVTDLENKSLIKFAKNEIIFEEGTLFIHDLLVQMGQKIADQERLWHQKDFVSILEENPGKIEIDKLKILWLKPCLLEKELCFGAFSKMKNLRMVRIFDNFQPLKWCGEYSKLKLSNELCSLHWFMYPFESLPVGFNPSNLVELKLSISSIKRLWDGNECFSKLKDISLRGSSVLRKIPNLSQVPNLEILDLFYCTNLSSIHPSVGLLQHLKKLICMGCQSLERLPNKIISKSLEVLNLGGCSKLRGLPNVIRSKSLKDLDLSYCLKLKNLPMVLGKMPSLQNICINGAAIKEFPFSFRELPFLEKFRAEGTCIGEIPVNIFFSKKARVLTIAFYDSNTSLGLPPSPLKCQILHGCIPSDEAKSNDLNSFYDGHRDFSEALFSNLKYLLDVSLNNCNLKAIPNCVGYWSIIELDLSNNRFMELPDSMCEISNLRKLILDNCASLRALPKLPLSLKFLSLKNCPLLPTNDSDSLVTYIGFDCKPHKILDLHYEDQHGWEEWIPNLLVACSPMLGLEIPEWFIHTGIGPSKAIRIYMDWDGCYPHFCALLIVYEVHRHDKGRSRKRKFDEPENSNISACEGNNGIFPEFVCQLQHWDLSPQQTIIRVLEAAHVGTHGIFVLMDFGSYQILELGKRWSLFVSVTASSENVKLKEFAAHPLNLNSKFEFDEDFSNISQLDLDSKSIRDFRCGLRVTGPIKPIPLP